MGRGKEGEGERHSKYYECAVGMLSLSLTLTHSLVVVCSQHRTTACLLNSTNHAVEKYVEFSATISGTSSREV